MSNYNDNMECVRKILEEGGQDVKMQNLGGLVSFVGEVGGTKKVWKTIPFRVRVEKKAVQVFGMFPVPACDNLSGMAEFIARVNYRRSGLGVFEMNYESGEVRFHVALKMSEVLARDGILSETIDFVVETLKQYSGGLLPVALGIRDAGDVFKELCDKKIIPSGYADDETKEYASSWANAICQSAERGLSQ